MDENDSIEDRMEDIPSISPESTPPNQYRVPPDDEESPLVQHVSPITESDHFASPILSKKYQHVHRVPSLSRDTTPGHVGPHKSQSFISHDSRFGDLPCRYSRTSSFDGGLSRSSSNNHGDFSSPSQERPDLPIEDVHHGPNGYPQPNDSNEWMLSLEPESQMQFPLASQYLPHVGLSPTQLENSSSPVEMIKKADPQPETQLMVDLTNTARNSDSDLKPSTSTDSNPQSPSLPAYSLPKNPEVVLDLLSKSGGDLYACVDGCLKSIQKCTFLVFTAIFLGVTFLHGSNYAGTCQSAEYGPSMNSEFYDTACSAARKDIITLIMTIQFLYVFMYLFCESHRNVKSELVVTAATKPNPEEFANEVIADSTINKRIACGVLLCTNELFLLITYIFVASSIVSILVIHADCKEPFKSIFRVSELVNVRTNGILPSFTSCTIGGMLSFSDAMNPALSALQLSRPAQSEGVTVSVMCFLSYAITLRLTTFFLICYLYTASLIIFVAMVIKMGYYANKVEKLVTSAVWFQYLTNLNK